MAIMENILVKCAGIDFAIQWLLFVVAAYFKTEMFFDLAGSGTIILLAFQSLKWGRTFFQRQKVQTGLVVTTSARLALFLFSRVLNEGQDKRFNHVRDHPARFFLYWTIQGIWVFMTVLPTLILNTDQTNEALCVRDFAGWGLWLVGFSLEMIADHQKSAFRDNPANKGKFIRSGLWSVCRHPNYLGEIVLWSGLYLSASSVMSGWQHLSILSPVFIAVQLTRVSGIPLLAKSGLKRWGSDPAYQAYLRDTPVLIPYLW